MVLMIRVVDQTSNDSGTAKLTAVARMGCSVEKYSVSFVC